MSNHRTRFSCFDVCSMLNMVMGCFEHDEVALFYCKKTTLLIYFRPHWRISRGLAYKFLRENPTVLAKFAYFLYPELSKNSDKKKK